MCRPIPTLIALMVLAVLCVLNGEYVLASGDELTVQKLKNAEYSLQRGKIKLTDGVYSNDRNGSGYRDTELFDIIAFGDLNGDEKSDAAAVLCTGTGYRRFQFELVVMVDDGGRPRQVASTVLSNKDGAKSVSIKSGEIILEMQKRVPEDPICCPSLSVTRKYRLQGGKLVLLK